ncbi:MAG TPA: ABC transporter permease [Tissierellaceae bacterium]
MQDKNNVYKNKKFNLIESIKNINFSSFTSTLLAILLGLFFGFLVMLFSSPANALRGFRLVAFGGLSRLGDVFYYATPILMTGLSVGFAFKMGLFNIGASGQYTMGMFFAMYAGFMLNLPKGIHWIVAILFGLVGGMLWGFIPGFFKALLNVNEVITSIMFNYIGMYLVDMWIRKSPIMYNSTMTRTNYIPQSAQIPSLGIEGSNVNFGIVLAILIGIILYIILQKTTFGYELKASGYNKHAAEYAGMKGKRNIILTMMIAGALSGLGGAFNILAPSGIPGSSITYEPINIIAPNGFNGIAVALLGNANPIGIIFSALIISHLQRGGTLSTLAGFKPEIVDVVIAIIIYFSAFSMILNSAIGKFIRRRFKKNDTVEDIQVEDEALDASNNNSKEAE